MSDIEVIPAGGPGGGGEGPAGPKGEFNYRGAYNGATAYVKGDAVTVGGSTYANILASTGVEPPEATHWATIAEKGAAGAGATEPEKKAIEGLNAKLEAAGGAVGALMCSIDSANQIRIHGGIKAKEEVVSGTILFTLPAACRPEKEKAFIVQDLTGGASSYPIIIKTTGEVEIKGLFKITKVLMFDGAAVFPAKG